MFSTIGLFKQISCPESSCQLLNCIFSHEPTSQQAGTDGVAVPSPSLNSTSKDGDEFERPHKKRRISGAFGDGEVLAVKTTNGFGVAGPSGAEGPTKTPSDAIALNNAVRKGNLPFTASRTVSPPPLRKQKVASATHAKVPDQNGAQNQPNGASEVRMVPSKPKRELKEESLNPRMLQNPPASHAVRLKLITMLYEHMVRLNNEVKSILDDSRAALELSDQEMITEVLEEEEKVAKEKPSVYSNILKLRIVALKKMKLEGWKKERLKQIAKHAPDEMLSSVSKPSNAIETGLSPAEEVAMLPRLFAKQEGLAKFGYVPVAASDADVEQARKGVEASQGWEQCDRCKSRFQVFPGRRPGDGALTSGGHCTYHYARPLRPTKEKADTGHKESIYPCCSQPVGSSIGCTTADSHVFKVSDVKRLALVMPFKKTPVQAYKKSDKAVCFDCESMSIFPPRLSLKSLVLTATIVGYTTLGMELIRLTATSWPDGDELLDVLVRPMGEILDLNSRFSGIRPEHYNNAIPYDASSQGSSNPEAGEALEPRLRLVGSPSTARDLLLQHLHPTTPLIAHAAENDLNAIRLIHPSLIDTVLLYPHPRGLPIRHGLKMLTKRHFDRNIQMGGARGHDSKEDARAAGELVRLKVAEMWKGMRREGWRVEDGVLFPPLPTGATGKGGKAVGGGGARLEGV